MDKNLKRGDIIIFEGGDNYISKTICWLTKSTVSHAAMVYDEDLMVEMGAKGIMTSKFTVSQGKAVHLMRLKEEHPTEPLVYAAKKYLDTKVEYDFPALVLLAGLLIYREVRPTPRWQRITNIVLGAACLALDKLLNIIIKKRKPVKAMVCSQLVYQVYLDAGEEYAIRIENILQDQNQDDPNRICLAALAENDGAYNDAGTQFSLERAAEIDTEQISRELYEALVETEEEELLAANLDLSKTVSGVREFLDLLEKILEKVHIDIPIPALFITPADIYERSENLVKVGDFDLQRNTVE